MDNERNREGITPWPYREALEELDKISSRVKANRLTVDKRALSLGLEVAQFTWEEMSLITGELDLFPGEVEALAREYDKLVRTGEYKELYGEYWPLKKLPPILRIEAVITEE